MSRKYFQEQAWAQHELNRIYENRDGKTESTVRRELQTMVSKLQTFTLTQHWLAELARDFSKGVPPPELKPMA